jgi:hypothetical protein
MFPRVNLELHIQVLYLVVVETANVLCDIGLIYEPLIIRYGEISP